MIQCPKCKFQFFLSKRSKKQNDLYWGWDLPHIAEYTGDNVMDLHEYIKRKFLTPKTITVAGHNVLIPGSTTDLSTKEHKELRERLKAWCAIDLGFELKDPPHFEDELSTSIIDRI
jgi:hypothetical protein